MRCCAASALPPETSLRILVVDDDSDMRDLLATVLARLGEVVVATDGIDGVDQFRAACGLGRPFDLVCLDIMMPGMDGHRTLTTLRRIEGDCAGVGRRAHVMMLTAVADRSAVQRAVAAGCDSYLVKPFTPDDVLRKLEALGLAAA